jgi:diacylglycerol kinase (ATP)
MKHIFIMNPAAGKGKAGKMFLPKIIETAKRLSVDYEIHRTIAPGDAEHFVRSRCEARTAAAASSTGPGNETQDVFRFYACGGDGTMNEVANGAYGFEHVEIAMIPAGTGNDYPRTFGDKEHFEDIEAQILGTAKPVDLIRYIFKMPETEPVMRYCINMFNIGLDCNVADKVAEIKRYPFIPGPLAYGVSVGIMLGKKEGVDLEITLDNGEVYDGPIMLIAVGNGRYCGGGFNGLPLACPDDGLIDVSIVGNISRRTFISLIGKYRKGTHLEDPGTKEFLTYRNCKKLKIRPHGIVKLCTDGEVSMTGETTFEIVPGGINFSVPQGCE